MVRVTVIYPNNGGRFDVDYYLAKHMPMVEQKLKAYGMKGWSVSKGVGGFAPGSAPAYLMQASLDVESIAQLQAGMAAESASIMADIPNYTDIQPAIQIDEILK